MILVKGTRGGNFRLHIDTVERSALYRIAGGYSMPLEQVLALCISKGMDICCDMLSQSSEHDKVVDKADTSFEGCTS